MVFVRPQQRTEVVLTSFNDRTVTVPGCEQDRTHTLPIVEDVGAWAGCHPRGLQGDGTPGSRRFLTLWPLSLTKWGLEWVAPQGSGCGV